MTSVPLRTIGVAIAIAEPHGRELQRLRESFGDPLAPSVPSHVTLLPPTPVELVALPAVQEHLRSVAAALAPFHIHLRGAGTFRPVSPVVFVPLVEGDQECRSVQAMVRTGPLNRQLEFPYHPHVTVAHRLPDDALDAAAASVSSYDVRFPAYGFSLYEHGPDGVWRPRRSFRFGDRPDGPRAPVPASRRPRTGAR